MHYKLVCLIVIDKTSLEELISLCQEFIEVLSRKNRIYSSAHIRLNLTHSDNISTIVLKG